MGVYNPGVVAQRQVFDGFSKIRVDDSTVAELLFQVILQLKIVSLKLNCLQPNEEMIGMDDIELNASDQ